MRDGDWYDNSASVSYSPAKQEMQHITRILLKFARNWYIQLYSFIMVKLTRK